MVGLITMVDGEFKAMLLGDSVVKGHTGDKVAKNMWGTATTQVGIPVSTMKKSCTSLGFDGQYFALDTPRGVAELLESTVQWLMPGAAFIAAAAVQLPFH